MNETGIFMNFLPNIVYNMQGKGFWIALIDKLFWIKKLKFISQNQRQEINAVKNFLHWSENVHKSWSRNV